MQLPFSDSVLFLLFVISVHPSTLLWRFFNDWLLATTLITFGNDTALKGARSSEASSWEFIHDAWVGDGLTHIALSASLSFGGLLAAAVDRKTESGVLGDEWVSELWHRLGWPVVFFTLLLRAFRTGPFTLRLVAHHACLGWHTNYFVSDHRLCHVNLIPDFFWNDRTVNHWYFACGHIFSNLNYNLRI